MDGIKSKERVQNFGEVFTPDSIVNDMIDLTEESFKNDYSIDKYLTTTYLEPACGNGQFLIRLLSRKLEKVIQLPESEREIGLIKSVCSIYGVDIQQDNVIESRARMMDIIRGKEVSTFDLNGKDNIIKIDLGITLSPEMLALVEKIIELNILVGNTLEPKNDPVLIMNEYVFDGDKVSFIRQEFEPNGVVLFSSEPVHYSQLLAALSDTNSLSDEIGFDDF